MRNKRIAATARRRKRKRGRGREIERKKARHQQHRKFTVFLHFVRGHQMRIMNTWKGIIRSENCELWIANHKSRGWKAESREQKKNRRRYTRNCPNIHANVRCKNIFHSKGVRSEHWRVRKKYFHSFHAPPHTHTHRSNLCPFRCLAVIKLN